MFHYNLEKLSKEQLARLLQLPNSLQKTMIAILELGEATASGVSEKTGRLRATESDYLNRLVKLTYLKKRREKRKTYFSPIIGKRRYGEEEASTAILPPS